MSVQIYDSPDYITFDFETTNLDKGSALNSNNRIVLVSWAVGLGPTRYALYGSKAFELFLSAINSATFLVAHNAKFELQWLATLGFDLSQFVVWDTMVAEYVFRGNRPLPINLEASCARHGIVAKSGFIPKAIKLGICPSTLPKQWVSEYCDEDVRATRELFLTQKVKYEHLIPVIYTRCLLTPVLADIERNGMHVDKDAVIQNYYEVLEEHNELRKKLDELTGGINPRSRKQVAEFLYDKLGFDDPAVNSSGKPRYKMAARRTDKGTLAKLKPKTKEQKLFLELKQQESLIAAKLSKTLAPLFSCVTETKDQILYGTFNQCVTQTHRLSSSGKKYGVQFQNFPRKYKYLFTARDPENYVVVEADEAQLEFRAAVFLGQDKQGISDIANKIDVHSFTAAVIQDSTYDYVVKHKETDKKIKEWRQDAKSDTFKPLYGGRSGTEAQMRYYEAFRKKYQQITDEQERWKFEVLANKKLVTCTGLVFYWDDTQLTKHGYITNSTMICNFPVQSLATADIVPIGVYLLWRAVKREKLRAVIINTVHDSVIAEVHKDDLLRFKEIANECLTSGIINYLNEVYNINFNIPLEVEIKSGSCWGGK